MLTEAADMNRCFSFCFTDVSTVWQRGREAFRNCRRWQICDKDLIGSTSRHLGEGVLRTTVDLDDFTLSAETHQTREHLWSEYDENEFDVPAAASLTLFFFLQYCLCMTEGILLFSAEGTIFCLKSRKNKVRVHWLCQALALVAAAVGLGFILASKVVSELPHLVSWHSVMGCCTLAASLLQAGCGACLVFHKQLRLSTSPARLKLYHATCGLVVYLLATGTIMLAMLSDWFQATVKGATWWLMAMLPLFPALVAMNQITNAYLPRKKISS